MFSWIVLAASITCNILGNFFIKRFSVRVQINNLFDYLDPSFVAGTLLFGVALLLYARALKEIPISLAYPVMVGFSMTALSLLAIFSLGERFGLRDAIGAVLVLSGVALLTRVG